MSAIHCASLPPIALRSSRNGSSSITSKKKRRFGEAFFSRNYFNFCARKASQQKCHHVWNLGCFNGYKKSHDTAAHGHANNAKNGLTVKLRFPCFLGSMVKGVLDTILYLAILPHPVTITQIIALNLHYERGGTSQIIPRQVLYDLD